MGAQPARKGIFVKLLVIADQHNSEEGLAWALETIAAHKPEVVVHLGDIISSRPASFTRETLRSLVATSRPVVVVPGNNDPRETLTDFKESGSISLHENVWEHGGVRFVGRGGSNPTPFNTPFEEDDDAMAATIAGLVKPGDVWCLHAPVHGFRDRLPDGTHSGVRSMRDLVTQTRPWVVFSGHIHDDWGMDVYKSTHFINPGSLQNLRAAVVELDMPKVRVNFICR